MFGFWLLVVSCAVKHFFFSTMYNVHSMKKYQIIDADIMSSTEKIEVHLLQEILIINKSNTSCLFEYS